MDPLMNTILYLREYFILKVRPLLWGKSREYPVRHIHALMPTNTNLDPRKYITSQPCDDISQPILPAVTSLLTIADFSEFHINIV